MQAVVEHGLHGPTSDTGNTRDTGDLAEAAGTGYPRREIGRRPGEAW